MGGGKHGGSTCIACLWLSLQYDWCSWIPNAPPTMRAPPPTAKGVVTIEQIVDTLPDRGRSCWHLGAVWALSQFQENEVRPCALLVDRLPQVQPTPHLRGFVIQPQGGPCPPGSSPSRKWPLRSSGLRHEGAGRLGRQRGGLCATGDLPHKATPTAPAADKALLVGFSCSEATTKFPGSPRHAHAHAPRLA